MADIGIIIGTGPSLEIQLPDIRRLHQQGARIYAVNNSYQDLPLGPRDAWIACDPLWHQEYSPVRLEARQFHWDRGICERYGYTWIEGRWFDGLSIDPAWIAYNHSSSAQALNLSVLDGNTVNLLAGFDMRYPPGRRHYFDGLSDQPGEYPPALQKFSSFDGLIECYEAIARQSGLPAIINCTPGSALRCFPMGQLTDYMQQGT